MNHIPEHFRKNIHPKDEKIQFMENDHSYFVDGEKIKFSVSEIIKIHFPEFDSNHWSRIKAIEELENRGELYTEFDVAFEQKVLLNQWEIKRKDSKGQSSEVKPQRRLSQWSNTSAGVNLLSKKVFGRPNNGAYQT